MKRRVLLAAVVLIVLIVGVVAYRYLGHPSLAPYRSLEVASVAGPEASLQVMFMGATTILLRDGQTAIMSDGFFSRPGPITVLFGKLEPNQSRIGDALTRSGVEKLAAVLVAHSHYDHAMDSPEVARRTDALLIGSESTATIAEAADFPKDRIRIIKGKETFTFDRFRVTVIESPHSPGGFFMGNIKPPLPLPARVGSYKEGGNYSYLIEHDGQRILIHPSANYLRGFLKNVRADVIFLGLGSLGKQSDLFAREYWQEVVQATGAKVVIPIHWDDFTTPLDQPLRPMPLLMDNFDRGMKTILQLAEADRVVVRFMPLFGAVDISELRK